MTLIEPALSTAPTLPGWFQAACRRFAPTPPTHRPAGQRDAVAPLLTAADVTTGMTAASTPSRQFSAEPHSRRRSDAPDIATEDWDLLFRAALELLARVAVEKAAPDGTGVQLQAPGAALRGCIDALDQLRRSVPPLGIQVHTEGGITSNPPAAASGC